MRTKALLAGLAALFLNAGASLADNCEYKLPDEKAQFRPGTGVEVAQNNCLSCHSADYVNTQPPRLGVKFWQVEVSKMVKAYHAPISEANAKAIVDYLSSTY